MHEELHQPASIGTLMHALTVCSIGTLSSGSAVTHSQSAQRSAPARLTSSACAGYGFSSSPTKRGFGVSEIAKTFNELMLQLGYDTYVAQGGHRSCSPSSPSAG